MPDLVRSPQTRKGARSLAAVPDSVLAALAQGSCETVNLMEWLAADMSLLAAGVAQEFAPGPVQDCLIGISPQLAGRSILQRLKMLGSGLAHAGVQIGDDHLERLATHKSDLVRQWACYAVNADAFAGTASGRHRRPRDLSGAIRHSVADRIGWTERFAADPNMSVREAAWMAVRPHVANDLSSAMLILTELAGSSDPNIRRFAVEVTRPRSVWGAHLGDLKARPQIAVGLLERVKSDPSRYVQLAVGNWLNDASKSQPRWVQATCAKWGRSKSKETQAIVRRGLRTIRALENSQPTSRVSRERPHEPELDVGR
jgi:3-methyladenine DNA glycosylase AlkC